MRMPHINLDENIGCSRVILPGDPKRAERVAEHLDNVEDLGMNREYRALKGTYKGVPVLSMSTGMGGPSTAIAVEELYKLGFKALIRIGSAGGLKGSLKKGDLVIVTGAIRDDGTSLTYVEPQYPAISDFSLTCILKIKAAELGYRHSLGIVRSHDALYSDRNPDLYSKWGATPALASDMETATLLTVASLRGLKAASILNVVAVHDSDIAASIGEYNDGNETAMSGETREIILALEALAALQEV